VIDRRLSFVLLFLLLSACARHRNPEAALAHATETFKHGNLIAADEEAKKGYEDFHAQSSEWAWKFRILNANVLLWRGMAGDALALLDSEREPPPAGDLTIQKIRLEGSANQALGRYPEAEQKLTEANRLCLSSSSASCSSVTFARGGLEMAQGHFSQAQLLFEQTLDLARRQGDKFVEANVLVNLGYSALQQDHFDEALDWSTTSYRLSSDSHFDDIAEGALGNLGWAYYELGESEKAEQLFEEARKRAFSLGDVEGQTWVTNLGYVYLDAGDYVRARQAYEEALSLSKKINNKDDILNSLMSLALVSERTGNLEQARDYADQTIALAPADGNRLNQLYPLLVKGHVAARLHDTELAEKTFREIEHAHESQVFLKWEAEHSLAQLYEDEKQAASADQEYRAALTTFETARFSLKHEESSLPFPANASRIYDDYIHFLVGQGKTAEALQVADYNRGQTLAEGLGFLKKGTSFKPDAPHAQAIARKAGGTILFYWLGEKQSYLWAITAQNTNVFPLPAKSEIEKKVQRYRRALAEHQEFLPTANDDAQTLYGTLVAPANAQLAKNAKVFILPDGELNTLNFETLLVPGPSPHYWIEDVTITDANSLRLLAAQRTGSHPTGGLLLLGDAITPNPDYPELRKAREEMQIVQKHFPPAQQRVFAREQATPPAYLDSKPEQFSYIHFVAHGTASRASPLDSAIVLTKAGPEVDSFRLYARNIIQHPLRAQLVTISTCYGAGNRAYSGEGLVGLSWAFLRAGAHNVIGALWEVSDDSTPRLMDELYSGLKRGDTPDTALRAAKLSLLHSGGAFAKPFYWAPFQLYTGS
jgi:CHAT domain-containing protein/Flp pilus assembly protein TadD